MARGRRWAPTSPVQKCSFSQAYLAAAYDFGGGRSPPGRYPSRQLAQQDEILDMLVRWCPPAHPVIQSDARLAIPGHGYRGRLRDAGFVQSMSGAKLPGRACRGLFGHMDNSSRAATGTTSRVVQGGSGGHIVTGTAPPSEEAERTDPGRVQNQS